MSRLLHESEKVKPARTSIEAAASYISPSAWAEFEALDSPAVWDEEEDGFDTLEDEPVYTDEDEDLGPCTALFRLLIP